MYNYTCTYLDIKHNDFACLNNKKTYIAISLWYGLWFAGAQKDFFSSERQTLVVKTQQKYLNPVWHHSKSCIKMYYSLQYLVVLE